MRLIAGVAVIALLSACASDAQVSPAPLATPLQTAPPISPSQRPRVTLHPTQIPEATPATPAPSAPTATEPANPAEYSYTYEEFEVPPGSHPHDVAPHPDGSVWYTAQNVGKMGRLDPATGEIQEVTLPSAGSAPHGVIVGPDNAVWVTDQGANTIERIDAETYEVTTFPMPNNQSMGPHTPTFDNEGILWFTGQGSGTVGRLDPTTATGDIQIFPAPLGAGPYGIDATPAGDVWYVNLAQSYLAQIDRQTGESTVYNPLTTAQGARRVWSDSNNRLWISEWNAGQLSRYDPANAQWKEWPLPANPNAPQAYAVYVDELDFVWVTDFGNNQIVRFDPATETFEPFPLPTRNAAVRQLLGREGEVWGAESAVDKLVVLRRSNDVS